MPRMHRSLAIPVLAASLVLLGACSSSTSSATKTTTKDGDSTTSVTKDTKASATTADGMSTTTRSSPSTSSVQVSGSYCDLVKEVRTEGDDLFSSDAGSDPAENLENLKQKWTKYMGQVHQIQANAPAEIQEDVDFRVEQFEKINARVQKLTSFNENDVSSLVGDIMIAPDAKQHNDRLEAYDKDTCKIDPTNGSASTD